MASTARRSILVGGLGRFIHLAPSAVAPNAVANLKEALAKEIERAYEAGYDVTNFDINPEDPAWSVQQVTELLNSKHFDVMTLGFGIRGNKEWTSLFEDLVNTARELSPRTKLGFSTSPADICGTIKRLFPDATL